MTVAVVTRHSRIRVSHRKVKDVVSKAASALIPIDNFISVAFLNDDEMSAINKMYTMRKGTTDVLSFSLGVGNQDRRWYGEVLISLDRARSQANEKGVSLINEVVRLLVHAVVHLRGFDHYDRQSFKDMRRMELKLLLECL